MFLIVLGLICFVIAMFSFGLLRIKNPRYYEELKKKGKVP